MSTNFTDMIHGMMARVSEERKASATNIRLGDFIDTLAKCDQTLPVEIDTGGSVDHFDSYRGYYEDLSAVPTDGPRSVEHVLAKARDVLGAVLVGYKGGDFPMHRASIMWVADYGCCGRKLVGLRVESERVVVETAPDDE